MMAEYEYKTDHWGKHIFPTNVDWEDLEDTEESYLVEVGRVGVDSASVTVDIALGDIMTDYTATFKSKVFTPEGDGVYRVLAGKIKNIGRCLLVAFDDEPERT